MNLGLEGKLAVVSGSTAGIGFGIASALAAEGAQVVVNGRTEERVTRAMDQLRKEHKGARVRGVAADLGTAEGVAKFIRQVPEADILVNNLGIFEVRPFQEISDPDWTRFFEVNVLGSLNVAQACLAYRFAEALRDDQGNRRGGRLRGQRASQRYQWRGRPRRRRRAHQHFVELMDKHRGSELLAPTWEPRALRGSSP